MGNAKQRIRGWSKSLVEKAAGMEIRSKYFYPHLRRLRSSWSSSDVIFDVGANDGRTIFRLRRQLPDPTIFAFEPVSSTYQTLIRRTEHLRPIRHFQCALGARAERKQIYLHKVAAMNSFDPEWESHEGTETVEVTTLDQVMKEQGIEFIHFLKVDTEGHDLEVLKGAQEALAASQIAILQVEAGVGQHERHFPTVEEFQHYLSPQGYLLYGVFNQAKMRVDVPMEWSTDKKAGFDFKALAYCDAVFVRAAGAA